MALIDAKPTASPKQRRYFATLLRHPLALAAHVVLALAVIAAVFTSVYPVDPLKQNLMSSLMPPSLKIDTFPGSQSAMPALMGTDALGRDLAARIILAVRISLSVSFLAVLIATVVGVFLGLIAGYVGGVLDSVIMRIVDALLSLPFVVLAIAVVAAIGPGLMNVALVLGLTGWVTFTKLVRGEVLRIKEYSFIEAAHSTGCSGRRILFRHILPQTSGLILVNATLTMGQMIISEATLSFLGLGVPPPTPTLGGILSDAQQTFFAAWWIVVFPGLVLMAIILAINLAGDFLRDYYNPGQEDAR
ncbi:MAG: ABC transporter permease [Spirochaetia bacterium]|jgi:peptide/nickel transport system permease protein|nr:ABC transporter permease [Spirochaetia bacterium]